MTRRLDKAVVVTGRDHGMGGFLNPPGHPEHTMSVSRRYANGREYGCSSLTNFLEDAHPWIGNDAAVRANIRGVLKRWEDSKPALETVAVQEWVLQVLGYFRHCYRNPSLNAPECWHAQHMIMGETQARIMDLLENDHAGVHHIRKYYPEFQPREEHWRGAYWGTKPAAASA
jgi:hypothetical protein